MKILKFLVITISLIFGTQAIAKIAEVVAPIAPVPSDSVQTTRELKEENQSDIKDEKVQSSDKPESVQSKLTDEIIDDLRSCKPQDEKYNFDIFGLNLSFRINIKGWKNEKCEYHMSAKVNSLSEDFRKSFGITVEDKKISKIEPKVECGFTKEQLNLLVDAVIEEDKRNVEQVNKLLKDPNAALELNNSNELTPSEKQLMDMLSQGEVCTIVNMDELIKQFSELVPEPEEKK